MILHQRRCLREFKRNNVLPQRMSLIDSFDLKHNFFLPFVPKLFSILRVLSKTLGTIFCVHISMKIQVLPPLLCCIDERPCCPAPASGVACRTRSTFGMANLFCCYSRPCRRSPDTWLIYRALSAVKKCPLVNLSCIECSKKKFNKHYK
jgi:hypothetical protein